MAVTDAWKNEISATKFDGLQKRVSWTREGKRIIFNPTTATDCSKVWQSPYMISQVIAKYNQDKDDPMALLTHYLGTVGDLPPILQK